ncbi:MBL fold metallo-hydrolase [Polaribacter aquimarinus]|uniref:MBL fold metallo-hydrolase n=1 Tax=Polaribacter aquimarinus TaxID=2100726 RepID=A0A2U2JDG7_9FLAO|nr:MBL fold metallo-hydrolase [Polaribacter aquimarinus]PWG06390.1 MBL fold metallo-hydrolase [Polaribacter aquimarinus]
MKKILFVFLLTSITLACKKNEQKEKNALVVKNNQIENEKVKITPITHATVVIQFKNQNIYLDPTGGAGTFSKFKNPTYVLITDIHGDHLNIKTLQALDLKQTTIIAPKAVAEKIKTINAQKIIVMNNGDKKSINNFKIEAIPMYNLREEALRFHPKGRGNGYVITIGNERIYFSGDTEDIPEMRNLKNIDKAFICMNLPYTMNIESAADAVLAFKPKKIYPYHYRGSNGLSDVTKFKQIVNNKNSSIDVIQWNWYP